MFLNLWETTPTNSNSEEDALANIYLFQVYQADYELYKWCIKIYTSANINDICQDQSYLIILLEGI